MSTPPALFDLEPDDLPPRSPADAAREAGGTPRLRTVIRYQTEMYWASLDQLPPMLDQITERYDETPKEAVVDGGFASQAAIESAAEKGCEVYAPVKNAAQQKAAGKDPYAPKPGDSPAVGGWRSRMGTAAAAAIYGLRCQTAEWVNAGCRNRDLLQMPLRGLVKCRIIATLHAIAHNLRIAGALRAEATLGAA